MVYSDFLIPGKNSPLEGGGGEGGPNTYCKFYPVIFSLCLRDARVSKNILQMDIAPWNRLFLQQVLHAAHFHPAVVVPSVRCAQGSSTTQCAEGSSAAQCGHAIKLRLHHHCHSLPESSK